APSNLTHAAAWNSIGTPTDLNPAGSPESSVYGVDGIHQVGGMPNDGRGFTSNAWLWTGTAASAVNLHPAGAVQSWAYAVAGAQQVGGASYTAPNNVYTHAVLWQGSAASVVDLNPPNYIASVAYGT